jgi:hypothetical protein
VTAANLYCRAKIPKKFLATPPALAQNYCFGGTSICDWPAFDFLR